MTDEKTPVNQSLWKALEEGTSRFRRGEIDPDTKEGGELYRRLREEIHYIRGHRETLADGVQARSQL